jgi:hypothetical protein
MVRTTGVLLLTLVLGLPGCGGKKRSSDGDDDQPTSQPGESMKAGGGGLIDHVTGKGDADPAVDFPGPLLGRLKVVGLETQGFVAATPEPYGAAACVRGIVSGLDLLLCRYATPAAASAAEERLLAFVGDAVTGVGRAFGAFGLAVADRQKVDLKGQTITKLLEALGAVSKDDVPPPPMP